MQNSGIPPTQLRKNAELLLAARLRGEALSRFPGELPSRLVEAYQSQDHAIVLRGIPVVGWKVGYIAPARRDESGDERVTGPIFSDQLAYAEHDSHWQWRFVAGGFSAVEAEYIFSINCELTGEKAAKSDQDLVHCVGGVHIGVELAGSSMAEINRMGPTAVASDFGNNNGLIVGPKLDLDLSKLVDPEQWQNQLASCEINATTVGLGGAAQIPGTPWHAFAFAVRRILRRGYSFTPGTLIATGASTGIHDVLAGDVATLSFWQAGREPQKISIHCQCQPNLLQAFLKSEAQSV